MKKQEIDRRVVDLETALKIKNIKINELQQELKMWKEINLIDTQNRKKEKAIVEGKNLRDFVLPSNSYHILLDTMKSLGLRKRYIVEWITDYSKKGLEWYYKRSIEELGEKLKEKALKDKEKDKEEGVGFRFFLLLFTHFFAFLIGVIIANSF